MAGALQDIRNFTVMILELKSGEVAGTGFIAYSDGQVVKIVTAAHVITGIFGVQSAQEVLGKLVGIYFPQAKELKEADKRRRACIQACLEEYDDDVVMLELVGTDPRLPFAQNQAMIGSAQSSQNNPYISYGFPNIGAYPASITDGTIMDLVPSRIEGVYKSNVVQLQASSLGIKIRKGMSGAAVLDKYRNLVVGIITEYWSEVSSGVAWAENCEILSFEPFGLNLLVEEKAVEIPFIPGVAFDRSSYENVQQPGLSLVHMPASLETWVGREDLLQALNNSWLNRECKVVGLTGFGGQGKSSLASKWIHLFLSNPKLSRPKGIFWWDFYHNRDISGFVSALLSFLTNTPETLLENSSTFARIEEIKNSLVEGSFLIVLDGFEVLQFQAGDLYGEVQDKDLLGLLEFLASINHKSFCLVTTRVPLVELVNKIYYKHQDVNEMANEEGVTLLRNLGVQGSNNTLKTLVAKWAGHPLTLMLLGTYIAEKYEGKLEAFSDGPFPETEEPQYERLHKLLIRYDQFLTIEERRFLQIFSAFQSFVDTKALQQVFRNHHTDVTVLLAKLTARQFKELVERLVRRGFIREANPSLGLLNKRKAASARKIYVVHPLIRNYFYDTLDKELRYAINMALRAYVQRIEIPERPKTIEQMRPAFDEVYYLCEAARYEEAYDVYEEKIWKYDYVSEGETGYITTVLSGYQADLEILRLFFVNKDLNNVPILSNPRARTTLFLLVGVDLDTLGSIEMAHKLYEKSAQAGIKIQEWEYATWSYQNEGASLGTAGKLKRGLKVLTMALRYAEKTEGRIAESVSTLVRIAWLNFLLGETEAADKFIALAKETYLEDSSGMVQSYKHSTEGTYLAEILSRTGRFDEALEVSIDNLAFLKKMDWTDDIGCHRVLGMIHEGLGDLRRAKNYYDKAFKFIFETGMREETALTLFRRGNLLVKLKKLDQANDDLRMALSIAQSCKYLWELDIRNALIRLAFEKGDASKDRLELRRELGGVLLRAKQTGYKWAESDAWLLLGDLEKITDHSKDAVKAYKHALRLQKQLRDPYIRLTLERLRELVDDYAYDQ